MSPAGYGDDVDWEALRAKPSVFIETVIGKEAFDYQKRFLDHPGKRKAFVSGRQVGKSLTAAWLALHKALTEPNATVLITAPSQRQSSLLFKTLRSEMGDSGFGDGMWGVDRDTQTILEFDNGSEIHCIPTGLDGSNVRGYSPALIIIDEAAFLDDTIITDVLVPSLFATGGDLVLTSTPWGTSGYFYRKGTQWAQDANDDNYSTWDSDNGGISSERSPLVDESDLEEYKRGKTKTQITQEVHGDFVDDGAQFFATDAIRACTQDRVGFTGSRAFLGADIAAAGADDTVLMAVDELGNLFHTECYGQMGVLDAAERISVIDKQFGFEQIVVDRSGLGQGTVEQLDTYADISGRVSNLYLTVQKKQTAYQSAKAELERGNFAIPIDEHGTQLRDQLAQIGYEKTKTGNLSLHARTGHDDYVDAMVLANWARPDTTGGQTRGAQGGTKARSFTMGRDRLNGSASTGRRYSRTSNQRRRSPRRDRQSRRRD